MLDLSLGISGAAAAAAAADGGGGRDDDEEEEGDDDLTRSGEVDFSLFFLAIVDGAGS